MIKEIIEQWDESKNSLEDYFRNKKQSEYCTYLNIVKAIFTYAIEGYDVSRIHQIDDGEYQGTLLFIIPKKEYQPCIDDYLYTYVDYGSCSLCDTLQGICDYDEDKPSKEQVKKYMILALHLVQHLNKFKEQ